MLEADGQAIARYWRDIFGGLDERTRSNVLATLTGILQPFLKGFFRDRFASFTNFVPELCRSGIIIILNFPVRKWDHAGLMMQNAFKYSFQRAMERELTTQSTRPVFLWADEYQNFIHPYDAEFQSTARSSKVASVYLTQNLPGLYRSVNSRHPENEVHSLIGNFQNKIFHQNTDNITAEYASAIIGRSLKARRQFSFSLSGNEGKGREKMREDRILAESDSSSGNSLGFSMSSQEEEEFDIAPYEFARLKKGGDGTAEAIITQGGRIYRHNKASYLKLIVEQR